MAAEQSSPRLADHLDQLGAGGLDYVLAYEQFRTADLVTFASAAQQAGIRSAWAQ